MEKRMHNSGFTLIEMCFVLSIITILMVCIPTITHRFDNFQLHCEVNRIVSLLLRAKNEAIRKRVTIMVEVHNNYLMINDSNYYFQSKVYCDSLNFHFNGRGNISQGNTITCYLMKEKESIIMNLGNGNIYVKK